MARITTFRYALDLRSDQQRLCLQYAGAFPQGSEMSSKIDVWAIALTARELIRRLKRAGCVIERQTGSHARVRCGRCVTTVPIHAGSDLAPGTLANIKRDLAPCIGEEAFR